MDLLSSPKREKQPYLLRVEGTGFWEQGSCLSKLWHWIQAFCAWLVFPLISISLGSNSFTYPVVLLGWPWAWLQGRICDPGVNCSLAQMIGIWMDMWHSLANVTTRNCTRIIKKGHSLLRAAKLVGTLLGLMQVIFAITSLRKEAKPLANQSKIRRQWSGDTIWALDPTIPHLSHQFSNFLVLEPLYTLRNY